mgnify:FL=1
MRQSLKKRMRKDQILSIAISVIKRKGFSNTKIEDIAVELNMTKGSIYYYFKNKNDLVYECHKLILSMAIKDLENILYENDTAENKLRKMIDVHIEYAIEEKEIIHIIIDPKEKFNKDQLDSVLKLRKYYSRIFDRVIQQGIEQNEFLTANPVLTRMIILGAMNWIQQWYNPKGKFNKQQIKEYYADQIMKLLK